MAIWIYLLLVSAISVAAHYLLRNLLHSVIVSTVTCCASAMAGVSLSPQGIMWLPVIAQPSNMFFRIILPSLILSVVTAIPFFVNRRMRKRESAG